MRHSAKKAKFRGGYDATRATSRKLVQNLILHGAIETTLPRAKTLKRLMERLVYKARERSEANKNVLLSRLGDTRMVTELFDKIGPHFRERVGGYVRVVKSGTRLGDGSQMARVEWVESIEEIKDQKLKIKTKTGSGKDTDKSLKDSKVDKRRTPNKSTEEKSRKKGKK